MIYDRLKYPGPEGFRQFVRERNPPSIISQNLMEARRQLNVIMREFVERSKFYRFQCWKLDIPTDDNLTRWPGIISYPQDGGKGELAAIEKATKYAQEGLEYLKSAIEVNDKEIKAKFPKPPPPKDRIEMEQNAKKRKAQQDFLKPKRPSKIP